jgi:hypothetical protein
VKATHYPFSEAADRGFVSLLAAVMHGAMTAPVSGGQHGPSLTVTENAPKPVVGWLERFDRWAARQRQRERERYLARSTDIFELEARIRELERRPYY